MIAALLLACNPTSPLPLPTDLPPLAACDPSVDAGDPSVRPPNIVLVVLDDVGVERLASWDQPHATWPDTPYIDALAAESLIFDRAYAMPTCSPTRFTLLTGRYGRRRGLGKPLSNEAWHVPLDEYTLPEALAEVGYTSTIAGKWHLSTGNSSLAGSHPLASGFSHHLGSLGNIPYASWRRYDDGVPTSTTTYPTTQTTDDAITLHLGMPEPWFLWVAFNAAHAPLHVPPTDLNPSGVTTANAPTELFHSMIEAFDIELERFMSTIDLTDTTVIFLGDNGTHRRHIPASWEPTGGKGSLFESGTRVPMFAIGAGVVPGRTQALVHSVDIYPTILEIAGIDLDSFSRTTAGKWDRITDITTAPWLEDWSEAEMPVVLDGAPFTELLCHPDAPVERDYIFTDRFLPLGPGPRTIDLSSIRSERFKLVRANGVDSLYDLEGRHDDGPDLLLEPLEPVAAIAYEELLLALESHLNTLAYRE